MRITKLVLRVMNMPLKEYFETSFGREKDREFIIVEAHGEGEIGYGEATVMHAPLYNEETLGTALHIIRDFLAPLVVGKDFAHPSDVAQVFKPIRRNNIAKAGVENAVWDLYAKTRQQSLAKVIGGVKTKIPVGVSIGIKESIPELLKTIEKYLLQNYRRIKMKIKPGWDIASVAAVRREFGDILLMADANSAYTLADIPMLKRLDEFRLMMIEQPLGHDDIIDHGVLQKELVTPICLDESIHNAEDARKAISIGACRIINIKLGRVGGHTEAIKIHDICRANAIPVWCGGMLESGVGRLHNVAITTLPNFILPGDTSGSDRYFDEDITDPTVTVDNEGYIHVSDEPGIGAQVNAEKFTVEKITIEAHN